MAARRKRGKNRIGKLAKALKPKGKPERLELLFFAPFIPFLVLIELAAKGLYYGIFYNPEKAKAAKKKGSK